MLRRFCLLISMTLLTILSVAAAPVTVFEGSELKTGVDAPSPLRPPPRLSVAATVFVYFNAIAIPIVLLSVLGCWAFHFCRRLRNIDRFRCFKENHLKPVDWDVDANPMQVPAIDDFFERRFPFLCRRGKTGK
ncbi:hypothetical protein QR680_016814 [Steinernema hermaphroditum]|uniref:Uncharacterized protein n=1 Tax=Steinernema hermaphroditum TaxID=289476 RepID=A0AA39HEI7_9BILA|nr:hypothetical protein QR680_016814 [Steinernema hermaphroditum]